MMKDSGVKFLVMGGLANSRAEFAQVVPREVKVAILIDDVPFEACPCKVVQWSFVTTKKSVTDDGQLSSRFPNLSTSRDPSAEAAVFFTSGSTSRPKPVVHTYQTLCWAAENYVFPVDTVSTLCFLPHFHVIMMNHNFLFPLSRGIAVAVHGADHSAIIGSKMLLKAAVALSPTIIDTVPFIMEEWANM